MSKRVLLVLLGIFSALAVVSPRAHSRAPQALLVVGEGTIGAGDRAVAARLTKLGYAVTVRPASAFAPREAADAAVVLVSSTARPEALRQRLGGIATPVVTWQSALFADLGLTGPTPGVDFGTASPSAALAIAQAQHPMALGLTGRIDVASSPLPMVWGLPGPDAVWIASLAEDTNHAALFGYEKGAGLVTGVAPARRVALFLTADSAPRLSATGWRLFDAAIAWAASPDQNADAPSLGPGQGTSTGTPTSNGPGLLVAPPLAAGAPVVNAGADLNVMITAPANLRATITDNGPGPLVVRWSVVTGIAGNGLGGVIFSAPNAATTQATFTFPGKYTLRVTATDGALSASDDIVVTVTAKVLFVVNKVTLEMPDVVMNTWMTGMGFTVTPRRAVDVVTSEAGNYALVVVSMTCDPLAARDKFAFSRVPVVVTHAGVWGPMGLIKSRGITNGRRNTVVIAGPPFHPIAGTMRGRQVLTSLPWGWLYATPAAGGVTVATIDVTPRIAAPTVFAFEKGAQLSAGKANERRVAMGYPARGTEHLVPAGGQLFQRALAWAAHFDLPPAVSAGANKSVTGAPATMALAGTATDSGLTGTPMTVTWSQMSGPATATFTKSNAVATSVTLPSAGAYVLRLSANDGLLTSTSDVTVTVN
jgi:hypothetical protein